MMYQEKEPPQISRSGEKLQVKVKDMLTKKAELTFETDLVVLVGGMVPRTDSKDISASFKIPLGVDRFFNEIHPKLRPVETVINGVLIGGSCQGPKNISESVQSALSASAKINAIISKETIELEPIVARIKADVCAWCGKCQEVCEYDAIFQLETNGKLIAAVNDPVCTGCGICAPVCPLDAIEIAQYTDKEIEGMIEGFLQEVSLSSAPSSGEEKPEISDKGMKDFPEIWRNIMQAMEKEPQTIPQLANTLSLTPELITWHLMTMNKYYILEPAGIDDQDEYYSYKLKK